MRPISLVRFNALAGYCRLPQALLHAEELKWFEHGGERVLGVSIRDPTDGDFGGIVLGLDRKGRFRWIGSPPYQESQRRAEALLRREMERLSMAPDEEYYQGDETGKPIDFFTPIVYSNKLSEDFVKLTEQEGFSPARSVIEPMMHWYEDPDGNFVEQFQTTGFDARLWELYLFATFVEMGYRIERVHAVPDFACVGIGGDFTVEAMTVNPTRDREGLVLPSPPRDTPEQVLSFLRDYMPIKFGSTLTSKLVKSYWETPSAKDKPLLFAIQDFSAAGSMLFTRSALHLYLYGYDHDWEHDNKGRLTITARRIEEHRWGDKVIRCGFFGLQGAENVSAVVFSNSGTISKFNRMGVLAGFGSRRVVLVRKGLHVNHDPNASDPHTFAHIVNSSEYFETWAQGLDVFHNPRAVRPIDPEMLPGAAHHRLLHDGQIDSLTPDFHPLGSMTFIVVAEDEVNANQYIRGGLPMPSSLELADQEPG